MAHWESNGKEHKYPTVTPSVGKSRHNTNFAIIKPLNTTMQYTTRLLALLASSALAALAPDAMPEHVKPLPGKCTIGMNKQDNFFWGGANNNAGGNVVSSQAYGFIVGTDGELTRVALHDGPDRLTEATGSYGGNGGGDFTVSAYLLGVNPITDCTVTFRRQSFTKSKVDKGTCDSYHGGGPFKGTSGCRCRFDC